VAHHFLANWVIGRSGQVAMLKIRSRRYADAMLYMELRMAGKVVKMI